MTYAAKLTAADFEIDWDRPVEEIHRLIRVGGAWTMFRGKRLKVIAARLVDGQLRPVDRATRRARRRCRSTRGATAPAPPPTNCSARCERRTRPTPDRSCRARRVALDALRRIEDDGAYANLVLGPMLATSGLSDMDRRFVTELVYGTTRMRRACDSLVDRFVTSPPDEATRSVLRLGAYQLVFAGVPPHAAVGETVGLAPKRTRGFVNAVLRKVSRLSIDGPAVAVGRGPAELSRLDRRPVPRRARRRRRRRRWSG